MKTKFLLTLLTLTGLLLSANSVFAATGSTPDRDLSITNLSQTIAELIDLDDLNLVELAIDRALLAQQVNEPKIPTPVTAGVPRADLKPTEQKPNVRGRINKIKEVPIGIIAQPKEPSIGQSQEPNVEPSIGQSKKSQP
jgi:hypothetical protein